MAWVEVPYNKYCYGRTTIIAYSDTGLIKRLDGTIEYTNHYKNGIKNQFTGGVKCGQ